MRPSSVASSTSLNLRPQHRQQSSYNPSATVKSTATESSSNPQHHHHYVPPPPEPDKLMTYEQAMIYAHPALKDARKNIYFYKNENFYFRFLYLVRLAHRRKMSSKNSGTNTSA